ncbi:MAG: hypothetical protein KatS3mg102_2776 [Planctomycetota bacterium]|nr:MAG: hypothetical protein KatS3mg102_2776 [Planctomycetota bacterium]
MPPSRPIAQVLAEHTPALMALPGVVGTAQARCDGRPCIRVMVEELTPELSRLLPAELEGYPVEVRLTGPIRPRPEAAED